MTEFCGIELKHPVINGSGTFDAIAARRVFGEQLDHSFPFAAFVSKTVTLEPRAGNPPPRLWETENGLINSIGLPNKGRERFISEDLPQLAALPVPLFVNVMGSTVDEFSELVSTFSRQDQVTALELNVSCPNVKTGLDIGADPVELERLVAAVRPLTDRPLIVKLTPNVESVATTAVAAQAGGADAVSLINTLRARPLTPGSDEPWLGGGSGGLSGPAIRSVALEQVAAVAAAVRIPVIGMGGIQNADHVREFFSAGATLVAIGTESFRDPLVAARIGAEIAC